MTNEREETSEEEKAWVKKHEIIFTNDYFPNIKKDNEGLKKKYGVGGNYGE